MCIWKVGLNRLYILMKSEALSSAILCLELKESVILAKNPMKQFFRLFKCTLISTVLTDWEISRWQCKKLEAFFRP